jgi:hypothetical protein
MDLVEQMMQYEQGDMSDEDAIKMFQELIDNGMTWKLQGHYGRTAARLIERGVCQPAGAAR